MPTEIPANRGARIAAISLIAFVGLVLVALFALRVFLTEERTGELARREAEKAIAGDVEIGRLEWERFPTAVLIEDLEVRDLERRVVLSVERALLSLEPRSLLRRTVRITRLDIDGTVVRLIPTEPEGYSLLEALGPGDEPHPEAPGWDVIVERASVTGGRIEVATDPVPIVVDGLELDHLSIRLVGGELTVELDASAEEVVLRDPDMDLFMSEVRAKGVEIVRNADTGEMSASAEIIEVQSADYAGAAARSASFRGIEVAYLQESGELSGSVERAEARSLAYQGITARLIEAAAGYEGRVLTVDGSLIDLMPGRARVDATLDLSEPVISLQAAVGLEAVDPGRVAAAWLDPRLLPHGIDGEMDIELRGLDEPRGTIQARLELAGMPEAVMAALPERARGAVPDTALLRAETTLSGEGFDIDSLLLRAANVSLLARGRVPWEEAPLSLSFELQHDSPGELLAALGAPVTALEARLSGEVFGELPALDARGELRAEGLSSDYFQRAALRAPFRLDDGVLHLDGARLDSAEGLIRASGRLGLLDEQGRIEDDPAIRATFSIRRVDVGAIDPAGIAGGSLEGDGVLAGTLSRPEARGSIASDDLTLAGIAFTRARAELRAGLEELTLVRLELFPAPVSVHTPTVLINLRAPSQASGKARRGPDAERTLVREHRTAAATPPEAWIGARPRQDRERLPAQEGLIEASGSYDLRAARVELALAVSEMPASLLTAPLADPPELGGTVDGRATLTGPVHEPVIEADIQGERLRVDGLSLGRARARAAGDLDEADVSVAIAGEAGMLRAEGTLRFWRRELEDVRVTGDGIVLRELPGLDALPFAVTGLLDLDLSADGPLAFPRVRGKARVRELAVDGRTVHEGLLAARIGPLEEGAWAVGVQLPGAVFIRARVDPGPPLLVEATGDLEDFHLGWVMPALVDAAVDARLVGEARLRYQRDPPELSASVHLPGLRIAVAEEELVARRPVTVRYEADTFILEDLELEGPLGRFEAGGAIGPRVSFMAFGRLDMVLLAAFIPQVVRSSGALALDVAASGTLAAPLLSGRLDLVEPIRMLPRGMLREVVVESLHASMAADRVDLFALAGHVAGGSFLAEGSMTLDGLDPPDIDLLFRGRGLPYRAFDLAGEVDADLRLTSIEDRFLLSGSVDAMRGRYLRALSLSGFSLVPTRAEPSDTEPPALLDLVDLDVRVTSVGAVDVRAEAGSFGVDLVLDADLWVTGTGSAPRVAGRIEAVRGLVRTPQADLPIVRAVADLAPLPDEPMRAIIDVVAEGEVLVPPVGRDPLQPVHFVTIVLEGEATDMSLDLLSQPPLDRLEVLSLLVTGRTSPRGLVPGDERHVESAMVFAGTRLAEPLTQAITERLEEVLNLDILVADVTVEGIAITAGTEVSRRLRLEGALQQGFGDTGALALARAQFLLSNTVFLEGATEAAAGNGGAGVEREGRRSTLEIRARVLGGG